MSLMSSSAWSALRLRYCYVGIKAGKASLPPLQPLADTKKSFGTKSLAERHQGRISMHDGQVWPHAKPHRHMHILWT